MRVLLLVVLLVVMASSLALFWDTPMETSSGVASCLAERGVKFYGASWCGHCNRQKEMFEDVGSLPYVECSGGAPECKAAGIKGFPTWVFPDGSRLMGARPVDELAAKAGCL